MEKGQGRSSLAFLLDARRRRARPEAAIDRAYPAWAARDKPDPAWWKDLLAAIRGPRISVIMPVHDPHPAWLHDAIASVEAQFYGDWELVVADDASASAEVRTILAPLGEHRQADLIRLGQPLGIAGATNAALARATGDFVTFLDHDDLLAPHALAAAALQIAANPALDFLFSDEDQLIRGRRVRPYFKPGVNFDLLLAQNLVGHMAVYRRSLVSALGGMRQGLDGSQDHDLALRALDEAGTARARHIPLVLYHWRQSPGSFSAAHAAQCREAARRAAGDLLEASAELAFGPALPQWPRIRFRLPQPRPAIRVIHDRTDPGSGDVLLFLHADLRPAAEDWQDELVAHLYRDGVGAAGALLTGPHGDLVHAGYQLDPEAIVLDHAPGSDSGDPGYRGQFRLARSVAAVSLDCLAVRRDVFLQAGGLTPAAGDFAGPDLCLRLAARGLRTVWTPYARLQYQRRVPLLREGAAWMRARWGAMLAADPYANPNLSLRGGKLRLTRAPVWTPTP